jgi:glutamate dehydrogenase
VSRSRTPFTKEYSSYARRKDLLIITKANSRSRVHRPVIMDRIGIKRYDKTGNGVLVAEDRFLGLFTSAAYSRSVREIPMVRLKVKRTIEKSTLNPGSHAGKALIEILETLPRDEILQMTDLELFHNALGILQIQERQRVALFTRTDVFERFVSCMVYVPRDRYTAEFREKASRILAEALNGQVTAVYTQVSDSPLARGQFIVQTTPGKIAEIDKKKVESALADASRTWSDRLLEALIEARGEETGLDIYRRFKNAFPTGYGERFSGAAAIYDIQKIEEVLKTGEIGVDLYRHIGEEQRQFHVKIAHTGNPVALSDLMPRLENMGVRVQSETPYEVRPTGVKEPARIRDFTLVSGGIQDDLRPVKPKFEETFLRVWKRDADDDGFNRLVLAADLEWHEVVVLRAYCKYLRQAGVALSEAYMQQTLATHTHITRLLMDLFKARFDLSIQRGTSGIGLTMDAEQQLHQSIEEALEGVKNPDEDRILRLYLNIVESTLRTNYYQRDAAGNRKPYLSFKLDSHAVKELPRPRPMFEIFVYSPRVEGIHLRGGRVARGGIRWSDRREDFRTEILGLMKAQQVKNAVIVPVGAKGGFVVKTPTAGREETMAEGIECYQMLIRGLLDLTDNLVGDKVVPPPNVVRRDTDDTYLVVAADKGTATFSDVANGVSAQYKFWLGDAFASGGSAGYDHKKMGITARGGWEAVKRHFRELGVNTQAEDFSVIGIGDMSGDVFGNAMLLSEHIQLIGAFNHLHIFVDPNPDTKKSLEERQRLFDLPRSSWIDYDKSLLSTGGAIFERSAKSLTVSEEVQARLDLPQRTLTPNELMQAILRARADLLWLGGIGTYVKSTDESHADVRDRANDPVRVNAPELRVRVVGEGANLGFTQFGRIEFALRGGKINTDAIDNSAGVDTSDHEVNIKILLDDAIRRGELEAGQRLPLLVDMTDEVARLVLRDNYQQTQAISVAEAQGESALDQQSRFMRSLEKANRLDRRIEYLPTDEVIADRHTAHTGLTRPELAVLLAYAKISTYQDLLASEFPDDPQLAEDLILYFPKPLRQKYRPAIERHRLRREIIATFVTNSMINRVGLTFVHRMSEETGRSTADVARGFSIIRDSFDLRTTWKSIERLDYTVPASLQTQMWLELKQLLERATLWLLRNEGRLELATSVAEYRPRIMALAQKLDQILPLSTMAMLQAKESENLRKGIPADLARRMASLSILTSALDVARIARKTQRDIEHVGRVYFGLGARFDLDRLRESASSIAAETPWQKTAVRSVVEDLYAYQSMLTSRVLAETDSAPNPIETWLASRSSLVARADQLTTELRSAPTVDLAMLTVATHQLRSLTES